MTWFTASSVSVNNNQTVVSVNAGDDIQIAQEAGGLIIGNNPPVEIKRTYLDGSSNKKIELRLPWPYGNQTAQSAVAFPTDADLAEATRVLRAVGSDAVTFSEALSQVLASTANTLTIETETSGDVTVVPYGKLTADVQALLATMGDFGVPLYGTDTKNQARTLLGLQPQVTAQPTLDLDFVNNEHRVYEPFGLTRKTITEAITTTRSSTATYNSPFGVASAAANIPRIEYDPATGECLGLLCEEARTNRLLYSLDLSTAWWVLSAGLTRTLGYADSPFGPSTAARLQFTGIDQRIFQNFTNAAVGDVDTLSVWVKGVAGETIRLGSYSAQNFVLTGKWQRISLVVTATATSGNFSVSTFGGATARDILVVAAQLESGSFPTSDILTEGSQVTRLSDRYSRTSRFFNNDAGAFVIKINSSLFNGNINAVIFEVTNPSRTERIEFRRTAPTFANVVITSASGAQSANSINLANNSIIALSFNANSVKFATPSGQITTVPRALLMGGEHTLSMGSNSLGDTFTRSSCVIKGLKTYAKALSDQELIDLTRI